MIYQHSKFDLKNSTATNVEIELPVPADSTNPNVRTSMGSASYAPENDALVWKIKSFPGGKVWLCIPSLVWVVCPHHCILKELC